MNLQHWLNQAILSLYVLNQQTAKNDAERILEKVTGKSSAYFLGFGENSLTEQQKNQANILLTRRICGEPLAYLLGEHEFWSLNFKILSGIFIPRCDTECLVEQVLRKCSSSNVLEVLDLGTGSGAIAAAIASECPNWKILGVDFLLQTVNLAKENINRLKINNVKILLGNWFHGLRRKKYDIIVSNPPYINKNDSNLLQGDVQFEPKTALISKQNGLFDLSYICYNSIQYLKLGGWLFLEHGCLQGNDVRVLFFKSGFKSITTVCDYGNRERVTYGQFL